MESITPALIIALILTAIFALLVLIANKWPNLAEFLMGVGAFLVVAFLIIHLFILPLLEL